MKTPTKLNLANLPTPLQHMVYNECRFVMKRDDLSGVELSGNKIRKLEYLLRNAKRNKSKYVFTCGGSQSNHCRATSVASAGLGLNTKLFLWGNDSVYPDGNIFLNKLIGVETEFLSKKEYKNVDELMNIEKERYENKGKKVYIIPTGGSNSLGIWGYISFIEELKNQVNLRSYHGILTAVGSGGTAAGLLIGLALNQLNIKVYGVNVILKEVESREIIMKLVHDCLKSYHIPAKVNPQNLIILDGFSEEGYKNISSDKLELIIDFYRKSGILLDPAYTGKAFFAFNKYFLKGKKRSNMLFLHTGGFLGVFSKRRNYLSCV
ncbi:1-aminocyclopropane-1-carboxylate deaminase/D-cysteine desulfhydrase [Bacteroidota bacterium]